MIDEPEIKTNETVKVARKLPSGRIVWVTVPLYYQKGNYYKKQIDVDQAMNARITMEEE